MQLLPVGHCNFCLSLCNHLLLAGGHVGADGQHVFQRVYIQFYIYLDSISQSCELSESLLFPTAKTVGFNLLLWFRSLMVNVVSASP
jgi:hypothetical protein